jgi:uncharacterized protein
VSHPLEPLVALQKKDRRLIKLLREMRDIPQRKKDIESQLEGTKRKLETAKSEGMKIEAQIKEVELEVGSIKEQIIKYKNQQMDAKTNEQYRAFVKEIGSAEREIDEQENREIQLMDYLERSKRDIQMLEERLEKEREAIADEIEELDERAADLAEEAEHMKDERRRAAGNVDPVLLKRYTRILQNKKDFALVFVEEGGHCGGCHMKLPPQVIHDARNHTKIVSCNFCGRIVYNPLGVS